MGKAVIALYTQDSRYANLFVDYCCKNEKERLVVKAFTNSESLYSYIGGHHVSLLLVEEELYDSHFEENAGSVSVLSEEKYVNKNRQGAIYKFQRIDIIFKQIYKILAETIELGELSCIAANPEVDVIGVFSPCYAEEREQFARELARIYSSRGKVLFVNMAVFTVYDYGCGEGMSDLLYYIKENGRSFEYKLQTLVQDVNGCVSLSGVRHYRDLKEMCSGDADKLFSLLRQFGGFERIIADIGFIDDAAFSIIKQCNKIWMPICSGQRENVRMKHMWHDFELEGRNELLDERINVELPDWWSIREGMRQKWVEALVNSQAG